MHSPGHVADTDEQAREDFWPRYLQVITHVAKTRGFAIPTKESFMSEVGPRGALYVGSPETVAQKIAANLTALGASRFDLKYGMGGLSHEALMRNIELYGTQVIPRVRELWAPDEPVAMIDAAAFPTLDDSEIAAIEALGSRRSVAAGEYLYREGDAKYDFYVVASGAVEIVLARRTARNGSLPATRAVVSWAS